MGQQEQEVMKLRELISEKINWNELWDKGAVMPMLYHSPDAKDQSGKHIPPDPNQPNIITKWNLDREKLKPGERVEPIKNFPNWQQYMDRWWASEKNKPEAKAKVDQIRWSAKQVGVELGEGTRCWKGYEKKGMKTMFGKRVPNCVKREHVDFCVNCHNLILDESLDENLKKWFKDKWVRMGPGGKIRGSCGGKSDGEGKPKCLPAKKAYALGKKGRASAARRKRRKDPNPDRRGKAINVATKKKKK